MSYRIKAEYGPSVLGNRWACTVQRKEWIWHDVWCSGRGRISGYHYSDPDKAMANAIARLFDHPQPFDMGEGPLPTAQQPRSNTFRLYAFDPYPRAT